MSANPVEVTSLGLNDDKDSVRYTIKVNTDRPIEQVDIKCTYADAAGGGGSETLIWQNIVGSSRKPIERGGQYEDQSYLGPDTVKAELVLSQVVFTDLSTWKP
jgi:hypothetical protein